MKQISGTTCGVSTQSREHWMDLARCLAIISVLVRHSIESVYNMGAWQWDVINEFNRAIRTIGHVFGSLGVPVFLLLSGGLLLKKQIDKDKTVMQFYKHNFLPLLIASEIWIIIYYIFNLMLYKTKFILTDLISYMFFNKVIPVMNMWYIPMILGVYLAIPFVAVVVKKFSIKALLPVVIINFTMWFFLPSIQVLCNAFGYHIAFSRFIDLSFLGGIYGMYILFGYYIANEKILSKISTKLVASIGILSFVISCIYVALIASRSYEYKTDYSLFTLFFTAICIFELCNRNPKIDVGNKRIFGSLVEWIARVSFGIYLLHVLFIEIMKDNFPFVRFSKPIGLIIMFTVAFIGCILILKFLHKRKISKWLFLMK